jgi:hypothetical protein
MIFLARDFEKLFDKYGTKVIQKDENNEFEEK